MELPHRTHPIPAEIVAVREVRIPVQAERADAVREFYETFFQLGGWPEYAAPLGGFGAGKPRRGIYFVYQHDPVVDANRPRLQLLVPSLAELIARLEERDWPYTRWHALGLAGDYLHVADPVGHVIQVRQVNPI